MGKDKRGLVSVHTASILPVLKKTLHMEESHIKDAHFVGKHRVWMCHVNSPVECRGCSANKVVCWALTSGELSYRCTTAWCRHPHPRWHVDEATMECVNVEDRVNALEVTLDRITEKDNWEILIDMQRDQFKVRKAFKTVIQQLDDLNKDVA